MDSVRVILEAVNTGNIELARRTVDAEVRKAPESDVYLCLKVFVAMRGNDKSTALETAAEAVKFCSKKTLEMFLVPSLTEYNASELLNLAFVRVNRQLPQDQQVCEMWLECALMLGNLESAQKALLSMQRIGSDPRSLNYQVCLVMAYNFFEGKEKAEASGSKPPASQALLPTLAARMLERHVPVETVGECFVAATVHKMTSMEAMTKFLQAHDSFITANLTLQLMLLAGLEATEQWETLRDEALKILEHTDSYNIWQALNRAQAKLGSAELSTVYDQKSGLNRTLALVDRAEVRGEATDEPLVKAWDALKNKPSAYYYLKPYVTKENIGLLSCSSDELVPHLNLSKLGHGVGDTSVGLWNDSAALIKLYQDHIKGASLDKTTLFVGTDALLMVVTSLLRKSASPHREFAREEAICLLEYALMKDPNHYLVKLLLIALYKSLGLHATAMGFFKTMDIKNLQVETLACRVSSRVATLSPQIGSWILRVAKHAANGVPNGGVYAGAVLAAGSFAHFHGTYELARRLRYAFSNALRVIEEFKLARLSREPTDLADLVAIDPTMLEDNRDLKTSFDDGLGPIDEAQLDLLCFGPREDRAYIQFSVEKELFIQQNRARTAVKSTFKPAQLPDSLTEIEAWSAKVLVALTGGETLPPLPGAPTNSLDWRFVHWSYTLLDTIKFVKQLKLPVADPTELTKQVRSAISGFQRNMANYESSAVKHLNSQKVPGNAAKVVRSIKQQHLEVLKQIGDAFK